MYINMDEARMNINIHPIHIYYYLRPKISAAVDIRAQRLTVRLI